MNLNFLIKKNHIFKRRKFFKYKITLNRAGKTAIYLQFQMLFELINLKIFKKILRKKYYKKGLNFKISRYWLMIRPNFLLTMKSKNSRMGSGTGNYVRVSSIIKADTPIFFFRNYSHLILRKIIKYVKIKMNIDLYIQYAYKKICKYCIK